MAARRQNLHAMGSIDQAAAFSEDADFRIGHVGFVLERNDLPALLSVGIEAEALPKGSLVPQRDLILFAGRADRFLHRDRHGLQHFL